MTSLPSTFSDFETIDDTNSTISEDNTIIHQTVSAQKNCSGNTSNLLIYLRDKQNITKNNYSEYLNEYEEPHVKLTNPNSSSCFPKRQELITRKVTSFIIKIVQPLFILQNLVFQDLLLTCKPGYKIPCKSQLKVYFIQHTYG
ncbi:hypothetical protein RhiirC2_791288 [Rhizophagus irregularis]|uniref:Uncharacterized protein n=1 Tax=Rhizophagus irregularis TaxID=588596 RepID=A0A2N1MJH4_9GLOM|nr:hypothetical protein RhiirC2_791288 [Rhizophagus irregularis]